MTALVVAVVLCVAGAWVLFASPWLRVADIRISGTDRTDVSVVRSLVEGAQGSAMAGVNTGRLAEQVGGLPLVQSVEVTRSWPSTLLVEVHEREAVAAVPSITGGVDLVDETGRILVHEDASPPGVPLVSVDVALAGPAALRAALDVNATLSHDVRLQVLSIMATSPDAVTLRMATGQLVVWGDSARPERKAEVLLRMLADPTARTAAVIDVSAPDVPATRQ
ncbi:MAG: cell division protein FtsQ/DivIB [Janthinobacterium lividum]